MGWGLHANEVLQTIAENGAAAVNVGGGCAAGGIAVHTAATMIAAGQVEVVAALGAEKMPKGFIPRPPGCPDDITDSDYLRWVAIGATNPAYWAIEARRRMHEHGTTAETLAAATVPDAPSRISQPTGAIPMPTDVAQVLASPMVADPLHLLQICAVSDGAAAVVLGSAEATRRVGGPLIQVAGSAVATGQFGDASVRIPTVSRNVVGSPVGHTSEVAGAATGAPGCRRPWELATSTCWRMADNTPWHLLAWPENFGFLEPGQADWMPRTRRVRHRGQAAARTPGAVASCPSARPPPRRASCRSPNLSGADSAEPRPAGRSRTPESGQSAVLGLGANGASIVLKG